MTFVFHSKMIVMKAKSSLRKAVTKTARKNPESGHVINVANLGVLNSAVEVLDTVYAPSNPDIAATALVTKKVNCDKAMKKVVDSDVLYSNAVSARNDAYHLMGVLSTRINNSFGSCGATDAAVKTMQSLTDKVHGARIGKLPAPPAPTPADPTPELPKTISVSQMGYDNRKANFEKQIAFVTAQPKYLPNEADLKVTALNLYVSSLTPLNKNVNDTLKDAQNARQLRDVELYAPVTGLYDLTKTVKKYSKSIDGTANPASKKIVNIKFTNHKIK